MDMANQEQVNILKQGVEIWNKWREEHNDITVDLTEANLREADLTQPFTRVNLRKADLNWADLSKANLNGAELFGADLEEADLRGTNLSKANLSAAYLTSANLGGANLSGTSLGGADLIGANLSGANLSGAGLMSANLYRANLTGANLTGAELAIASLIDTNLTNANLTGCHVFGISVWNVDLEGAVQKDLVITDDGEPEITVDNLEVAQFIYLLNNQNIRNVIDTITSKVVLILGRFTPERKPVLDALRDELRKHNFSPVVFDFEPSASRNLTETVSLLANMSRFVIADLTDAKSIPQELQAIVPHLPSVPIQPILQRDATEYAMFEHYERYPWVLPIYRYQDIPDLLASFKEHILKSVEQKEYEKDKNKVLEEEVKNKDEKIRELEEKVRMLEQNK
jgi:uncharacterized protein YjbI with pentapeptide repeats